MWEAPPRASNAPPKPLDSVLVIILIDSHVGDDGVRSGHCSSHAFENSALLMDLRMWKATPPLVPADRLFHRPPRSIQSICITRSGAWLLKLAAAAPELAAMCAAAAAA
jgi:hypothetical protein